jgi:hypothetical protein
MTLQRSILAILLLAAGALVQAQTAAGTLIVNQAQATIRGETRVPSNQVVSLVAELCRVRLSPESLQADPVQSRLTLEGAAVAIPFRVTNVGNATFEFTLDVLIAESDWEPTAVTFYRDREQTSRIDPGDPRVSSIELAPRATAALVMLIDAPSGEVGNLLLTPVAKCPPTQGAALAALAGAISTPDSELSFAQIGLRDATSPIVNSSVSLEESGQVVDADGVSRSRVVVRVASENIGGDANQEVEVVVPLDGQGGACFAFQDASADRGEVDVLVGPSWVSAATAVRLLGSEVFPASAARAIRLRLAALAGGEVAELLLEFDLIEERCGGQSLPTIGTEARVGNDVTRSVAIAEIRPRFEARLSFLPLSGVADALAATASSETLLVGRPRCYPLLLENLGNAEDSYRLSFATTLPAADRSQARLTLQSAAGLAVSPTFLLDPGESTRVDLCLILDRVTNPFDLVVRLTADRASSSPSARVAIDRVILPDALNLELIATPQGSLNAGSEVEIRARIGNDFAFMLRQVTATVALLSAFAPDGRQLDAPFSFIDADAGVDLDPDALSLRWAAGGIEPGFERSMGFRIRLADDLPDGSRISFALSAAASELDALSFSPPLELLVWNEPIGFDLTLSRSHAAPGERIELRASLVNPASEALVINLDVSELSGGDLLGFTVTGGAAAPLLSAAVANAGVGERALSASSAPSSQIALRLEPGEHAAVTFQIRINFGGADALSGAVVATLATLDDEPLGSERRSFVLPLDPGVFRRDQGVLVGVIFVDMDGDGFFDSGRDTPLAGVRVLLPDGRTVISDAAGRYQFRDLEVGWWRVLYDPATLPNALRSTPQGGDGFVQRVFVQGLTRLDAPIAPSAVQVALGRSSELQFGPLSLRQQATPLAEGVEAVELWIELKSDEPLTEVRVRWGSDEPHTELYFQVFEGAWSGLVRFPAGAFESDAEVEWRFR